MTEPISTSLPIDSSLLPASVRQAGPRAEQLYTTALQFEQLLVEQLSQQLQQTDGSDGSSDGSSGSDGTTALYQQMLPGAMAQGVTNAGGLGLANELYQSLAAAQGVATTAAPSPAANAPASGSAPAGAL